MLFCSPQLQRVVIWLTVALLSACSSLAFDFSHHQGLHIHLLTDIFGFSNHSVFTGATRLFAICSHEWVCNERIHKAALSDIAWTTFRKFPIERTAGKQPSWNSPVLVLMQHVAVFYVCVTHYVWWYKTIRPKNFNIKSNLIEYNAFPKTSYVSQIIIMNNNAIQSNPRT